MFGPRGLAKDARDAILASWCLLFLLPVMVVLAVLVKRESPGPVLFRQARIGLDEQKFEILKFRTLRHELADPRADRLVGAADPRVTSIGRFLRNTGLDELPQFWNVLRGDMSMVGPRPHAPEAKAAGRHYHDVVPNYWSRHVVKPGITGLAQVKGWRGSTDTAEHIIKRVECDLEYIHRASPALDLIILVKTPWVMLRGEQRTRPGDTHRVTGGSRLTDGSQPSAETNHRAG